MIQLLAFSERNQPNSKIFSSYVKSENFKTSQTTGVSGLIRMCEQLYVQRDVNSRKPWPNRLRFTYRL